MVAWFPRVFSEAGRAGGHSEDEPSSRRARKHNAKLYGRPIEESIGPDSRLGHSRRCNQVLVLSAHWANARPCCRLTSVTPLPWSVGEPGAQPAHNKPIGQIKE
jgi:hypothetical protein